MLMTNLAVRRAVLCSSFTICLSALMVCVSARTLTAQTVQQSQPPQNQSVQNYEAERQRALQLLRDSRHTEALPIFRRLAASNPSDAQVQYGLGFAEYVASQAILDATARRQARIRARASMLRAKELGLNNELIDSVIASIPLDGSDTRRYSENAQADAAMREGEAAFARGELDAAITAYERALRFDARLYNAALFAGDMYFKKGLRPGVGAEEKNRLMIQAGEWFARAIAIDPNLETAYRYWGSALMEQGRMDEALEKVIEAYITEPYARLSSQGLARWASMNNVRRLAHPQVEGLPAPLNSFPEEVAALRARAGAAARELRTRQTVDPPSGILAQLNDDGLLESYVLLARVNESIAREYPTYMRANRDKLRRYVRDYIVNGDTTMGGIGPGPSVRPR